MDAAAASSPRAGKKQKAPSGAASPAVGGSKPKRLKTAQAGIVSWPTVFGVQHNITLYRARYQARPSVLARGLYGCTRTVGEAMHPSSVVKVDMRADHQIPAARHEDAGLSATP